MKTANLLWIVFATALLAVNGCAGRPHGHPGASGDARMQEVVPEVKELVEQNVKDPEKSKQVQAMVQEIVKEVRKSNQAVRGYHEQLASLNASYDAKPEQFTKILDALNNTRMESATKILTTRFKIKDMLSVEEWKNLNDAMAKSRREHEPKGMTGGAMTGGPPTNISGY